MVSIVCYYGVATVHVATVIVYVCICTTATRAKPCTYLDCLQQVIAQY